MSYITDTLTLSLYTFYITKCVSRRRITIFVSKLSGVALKFGLLFA